MSGVVQEAQQMCEMRGIGEGEDCWDSFAIPELLGLIGFK